MKYPTVFEELVICFKKFAGVGTKSAERMAYQVLTFSKEDVAFFSETLLAMKTKIKFCSICGHISEEDTCLICQDDSRNEHTLCVVQSSRDVFALEKANDFRGRYHVLNGIISAVNGVGPQDINLESLIERVKNGSLKEIILATNPNVEGETTALYIARLLEDYPVTTTRLAYGLPVGGNLDYADAFTLLKAFEGRKKI